MTAVIYAEYACSVLDYLVRQENFDKPVRVVTLAEHLGRKEGAVKVDLLRFKEVGWVELEYLEDMSGVWLVTTLYVTVSGLELLSRTDRGSETLREEFG